jgi:3-deoxy-D-manno-octulosonic-acid transferase
MQVADATALVAELCALLEDSARRAAMHEAALAFHTAHRGAAERLWVWLAPQVAAALADDPTAPRAAPVSREAAG